MKKTEIKRSQMTYCAVLETKCDLCGKTVNQNGWTDKKGSVLETEIKLKEGFANRDFGSTKETTVDICPDCFKSKLIPWVQSHGGQPTEIELSY